MSSSKQTTKQTQTTTPNVPDWVTQGSQNLAGQVQGLAGQDPASFVAGPSELQNQQFGLAGQFGAASGGLLQGAARGAQNAMGYQPQQVTGQTAYGGIGSYMNPYTDMVIQSGLQDNERARQMAGIDTAAAATAAHAFGGSRHGVADAQTNEGYDRNALNFVGSQLQSGFGTALGASQQDADRAQAAQVANQGAGLAGAGLNLQGAQTLGGLGQYGYGALSDAGATQQGIDQNKAGAPLNVLQQLSGTNGNLGLGMYAGQTTNSTGTTKTNSGLGGMLGGLGTLGFGLGSLGVKI